MKGVKAVLLIMLLILIAIQFVQPARNKSGEVLPIDITNVYPVPVKVQMLLKNACYDCHSNNTRYPWYASLQPLGWWLASHIKKGKEDLNFSEFGNYSIRRKDSKLKAIANSIEDETMPIPAYLLIHKDARLTVSDKKLLLDWVQTTRDRISQ